MKHGSSWRVGLGGIVLLAAASAAAAPRDAPARPHLVELFTSQGCSSCPPAERLFATLADDPDYVTIEYHVDYWDRLVHGGAAWKDPFSKADFTERQRDYNQALRGTRAVYTPQAVFAGTQEFVGSHPAELAAARKEAATPSVSMTASDGAVRVTGKGAGDVIFVRLLDRHETRVKSGENSGRTLAGRHIALEVVRLGAWTGKPQDFDMPTLKTGETCALFVQSEFGPVLGAAYCAPSE